MTTMPTTNGAAPNRGGDTLVGQVALVTGGGTGIGLGCARALAADGAQVVIAGRRVDVLRSAADQLNAELGDLRAHPVVCDVTDEAAVTAAVSAAASLGRFTMCVANAGFGHAAPFHLTSLDDWNRVLTTNLTGAFLTIRAAVTAMVAAGATSQQPSSIVAVSSIAGPLTHRFMTPYSVSKAGLEMLVRQVADELGGSGIRCNAVRPGLVPTDATIALTTTDVLRDDYLAQMPLARTGTEADVAALVRFLLGPESSWITGQIIGVDGGHTLRRGPDITPVMEMALGPLVRP
jgi:NAD(P)-dependent dehydrogenase (short-subunit alcohol dehydrogenase family)